MSGSGEQMLVALKLSKASNLGEVLETRRLPLQKIEDLSYPVLCNEVERIFDILLPTFYYVDEDGDRCDVKCTEDLFSAAEVATKILQRQTLHLNVLPEACTVPPQPRTPQPSVPQGSHSNNRPAWMSSVDACLASMGPLAAAGSAMSTLMPLITSQLQNAAAAASTSTNPASEVPFASAYESSATERGEPSADTPAGPAIHTGITCDVCNQGPIRGCRYKCAVRQDYDLCQQCYLQDTSPFPYLCVKRPEMAPAAIICILKDDQGGQGDFYYSPPCHLFRPHCHRDGRRQGRCARGRTHPTPAAASQEASTAAAQGVAEEDSAASSAVPAAPEPVPVTVTTSAPFSTTAESKPMARFVKDITCRDGQSFAPNTKFTKVWRMSNDGSAALPEGTLLVCVGGENIGEPPEGVALTRNVPAGEEFDIAVEMTAPASPGSYISFWRLRSPEGNFFGHKLWVEIVVLPETMEDWDIIAPQPQPEQSSSSSKEDDMQAWQQELLILEGMGFEYNNHLMNLLKKFIPRPGLGVERGMDRVISVLLDGGGRGEKELQQETR